MNDNPFAWIYEKPCHICGCGLDGLPGIKDSNASWRHSRLDFCVIALGKRVHSLVVGTAA